MSAPTKNQQGFTAVELLITLIIAAVFMFAGFQLYTQVTRDGTDANKSAVVSSKVNERLRRQANQTTAALPGGCVAANLPATILTPATETVPGVGTVTYTTTLRCSSNPVTIDVFLIKIDGSYNDAGIVKEVEHATYVN
jgi:prepilin-type N-terminal cleavage/methylation domain-containing protein